MLSPVALSLVTIAASALLAPRFLGGRSPYFHFADLLGMGLGFAGMVISAALQSEPASTWSAFIDLGSFAVGTSLIVTSAPHSWPRHVGTFIVGIHLAQVLVTNAGAPFGA